jgi:hypothetical protein
MPLMGFTSLWSLILIDYFVWLGVEYDLEWNFKVLIHLKMKLLKVLPQDYFWTSKSLIVVKVHSKYIYHSQLVSSSLKFPFHFCLSGFLPFTKQQKYSLRWYFPQKYMQIKSDFPIINLFLSILQYYLIDSNLCCSGLETATQNWMGPKLTINQST